MHYAFITIIKSYFEFVFFFQFVIWNWNIVEKKWIITNPLISDIPIAHIFTIVIWQFIHRNHFFLFH